MDSEVNGPGDQWLPVPEAAALVGVPTRSVYNRVKSRRLASRNEDGVLKVELGALRAMAAERPRANGRAGAGNTAGTGLGSGKVAAEDGAMASRLFGLFESGMAPAEVVRQECLPPKTVIETFRAFTALKEMGNGSGRPSLEARVTAEEWMNGVGEDLAGLRRHASQLLSRVENLERHVADLPVSTASEFICPDCGSRGHVGITLTCLNTRCGKQRVWSKTWPQGYASET